MATELGFFSSPFPHLKNTLLLGSTPMLCCLAEWGGKAVARDAFNVEIKILVVSICGDRARATAARKELEGNSYGKKTLHRVSGI